jgi:hypothetical protein
MPRLSMWIMTATMASSLAAAASAQTQTPKDPGAAANVRQSQQYEQVLQGNSAFRAKRMQQECGPITDPQLHESCVASFGGGASGSTKQRQR